MDCRLPFLFRRFLLLQPLLQEVEIFLEVVVGVGQGRVTALLLWYSIEGNAIGQLCVLELERNENPIENVVVLIALLYEFLLEEAL